MGRVSLGVNSDCGRRRCRHQRSISRVKTDSPAAAASAPRARVSGVRESLTDAAGLVEGLSAPVALESPLDRPIGAELPARELTADPLGSATYGKVPPNFWSFASTLSPAASASTILP